MFWILCAILSGGLLHPRLRNEQLIRVTLTSDRARMAPRPQGSRVGLFPVSPPFCSAFSFLKSWLLAHCVLPAVLTTGA